MSASDGRTIDAINAPMPDGGWVSTHEDITEQQELLQQRDDMAKQQKRRGAVDAAIATFRMSMETLLKSFGDSAAAMKSTAVSLLAAANHSAQSATSAVTASNDASSGVTRLVGECDHKIGGYRNRSSYSAIEALACSLKLCSVTNVSD